MILFIILFFVNHILFVLSFTEHISPKTKYSIQKEKKKLKRKKILSVNKLLLKDVLRVEKKNGATLPWYSLLTKFSDSTGDAVIASHCSVSRKLGWLGKYYHPTLGTTVRKCDLNWCGSPNKQLSLGFIWSTYIWLPIMGKELS